MSDEKKVELNVPKSLLVVLWVAAIGLVLNGVQPLLSSQANANSDVVHKIAICKSTDPNRCAAIVDTGGYNPLNGLYIYRGQ